MRLTGLGWAVALGWSLAAMVYADSGGPSQERGWIQIASAGLDSRALDAITHIHDTARQLLALRAYLRAGVALPERWSWSKRQLSTYQSTTEGKAAAADLDTVSQAFALANPGYTLSINRKPRSLELQLSRWNENASVAAVAAQLAASLHLEFPPSSTPTGMQLRSALTAWKPAVAAALAAPGLSAHGQGRAFDFEVEHDGRSVAGFEAAAARQQWDQAGWTQKLHAAIVATGRPFTGPLESPYEPWHYAYAPRSQ